MFRSTWGEEVGEMDHKIPAKLHNYHNSPQKVASIVLNNKLRPTVVSKVMIMTSSQFVFC